MGINNIEIRNMVSDRGLHYKDIAKELGMTPEWLSRLLKDPLTEKNKEKIVQAADRLAIRGGMKAMQFAVLECVESGDGFLQGCFYSSTGTNNGIQVQRENNVGDCVTYVYQCGGYGKGVVNNYDNSGKPSFIFRAWRIL